MPDRARKILVVEDNPLVLRLVKKRLLWEGFDVATSTGSTTAIRKVHEYGPDLMVLDLSLIDDDPFYSLIDGFALLAWLRRTIPELKFPVILYTVEDSEKLVEPAQEAGIYAICRKVGTLDNLVATIRQAFAEEEAAA